MRTGVAPIAVLAVGLLLTGLVWLFVRGAVQEEANLRFIDAADGIERGIVDRLDAAAATTQDMAAFLVDQPVPGPEEWDRRLAEIAVTDRFPAIRALNFSRAVQADELADFEERTGLEVFPERDDIDLHAVIELVHPLETNRGARGLDILARPGARPSTLAAAETGEVTASDSIVLVQDADQAAGFVLYDAIYDGAPTTPQERAAALRGWVNAAFRAQDLVDALDLNTRLVAFELRDVERAEPEAPEVLATGGEWVDRPDRAEVRPLDLFGQRWELELRSSGPLVGPIEGRAPLLSLLLGTALTLGASAYVRSLRRDELRAVAGEAQAIARLEESNAELAVINDELEHANHRLAASNAELGDLNERLVAANEVKDDFLAVVSHEFRTPLTVIRGFATTVLDNHGDELPDRIRDALGRIDRNADRLNGLVDDLLVAARIERGVVQPSPTDVDLPHLCVEVIEELGWGAEVELALEPAVAHADLGHVRRIVENLLGNAAKYGAPPVVVSSAARDGVVEVRVRDHGPGIRPELADVLFRAFTQGERGPRRRGQGVGLGLAISRQLAGLNQGSLELVDPGHGGAHFLLRLPPAMAVADVSG